MKKTRTCVVVRVRQLLPSAHPRHPRPLLFPPSTLFNIAMIQFINLPRLNIISDILPIITKNALDAKYEFPMRPLGHEWGQWTAIIPAAWLVWRTQWKVIVAAAAASSQKNYGRWCSTACALETIT